jgi:hypothetical protein
LKDLELLNQTVSILLEQLLQRGNLGLVFLMEVASQQLFVLFFVEVGPGLVQIF